MPQDTERLFIMTRPGHLFFKAAIPGALGMLLSSMYYLLEAILVGRVLGAEAFAGLNLAMPFVIINYAVADLTDELESLSGSVAWIDVAKEIDHIRLTGSVSISR